MTEHPNCKINIGLSVVAKRPDGYHNLESVFYPLPICDTLEILKADNFSFEQDGIALDCAGSDNLCVKAYRLMQKDFPQIGPVAIRLTKNIPSGAGMGGGSSDAAFTIKMLNSLFKLGLHTEQLQGYAARIGADCAFFIENKAVFASQKGDVFQDIALDLSGYRLLLVKPEVGVSTSEAYKSIVPAPAHFDLRKLGSTPMKEWKQLVTNDFEKSVFEKLTVLREIKERMYQGGAVYAAMSGSGSTIYGFFAKNQDITELRTDFDKRFFMAEIEF